MNEEATIPARFDARAVNVTKLTSIVDCEILMQECTFAVGMIDEQLDIPGFGDESWKDAALTARREFLHKRGLAEMKRAALVERAKPEIASPEQNFRTRFMKSAQDILPADVYTLIFESARRKEAA